MCKVHSHFPPLFLRDLDENPDITLAGLNLQNMDEFTVFDLIGGEDIALSTTANFAIPSIKEFELVLACMQSVSASRLKQLLRL